MDDPRCSPPSRQEIPTAAAVEETDDGLDRISDLPGEIIHHIVSFLPTREASRASAVSTTFRSVMGSFPIIDFDLDPFLKNSYTPFDERMAEFLNYVHDSTKRRRSRELDCCIQKFRLVARIPSRLISIWNGIESDHRINRAISFAIEGGVKELEIDLAFHAHYLFPKLITPSDKSKSITTLKLKGCRLDLNDLILSCPMIESLNLAHCWFNDVMILSPTLRAFELQCCCQGELYGIQSLQVVAANLRSFMCRGNFESPDIGIGACKNLKDLALYNIGVTTEWLHEQISQLHGLDNLVLGQCYCLERLEISHQNLKSLCLLDCYVEDVEVDAPKLVSFMYKGRVVAFRLLNPAAAVLDATLIFRGRQSRKTNCFIRFRNFLSSFGHCKALTLCSSKKHLIFPQDLRDILYSPLCHLKHLKVITSSMPSYIKLVDGLLWLAPRLETLCFSSKGTKDQDSKAKFIKFYYGNTHEEEGRDSNCFCNQHLKCCRCHLKLVETVNFESVDDRDNLLKYFQQKTKSHRIVSKNT